MPKIRVIPVTGLPQFDGWSQVIELPAHSSVKTVMSIAVEGAHAGNVGRDIANFILAQTVETVESFYQLLEEIHAQALENEVRILLSAGFFLQGSCAYATLNGAVLLKRDAQVGVILSSGNTLQLITGKSTLQDVVVFSPLSSSHFFDEIKLKFEQGYDADTVVASVVPGIHGEANSSRSALAFVSFSPFSSEAVEQPPSESSTSRNFEERQSPLPAYRATPSRERIPLSPSRQTAYASAASISTTPEVQEAAAEAENREDSFISTLEDPIDTSSTTKPPVLSILGSVASGTGQFILTHLGRLARTAATGVRGSIPLVREAVLKVRSEKKQPSSVPVAEPISGSEQSLPAESWKSALRSLLPNRDVYIETSERKKAKYIRVGVVILSILLVVGAIVALSMSQRSAQKTAAEAALAPLQEQVAQAEQLVETNPVEARNQVQTVLRAVEELQSQHEPSSVFYQTVSEQRQSIQTLYESISGLEELQELPVFYDLRLVSSDFIASKVIRTQNTAYFVDNERKTLIELNLDTKQVRKVSVPLDTLRDIAWFDSQVVVLGTGGVQSVNFGDETTAEATVAELIAEGDSNREASLLAAYDPYIYVVNPEKRNIYRYAESAGSFSDPVGWMQEVVRDLSYADVVSIAIDGDVWLGTKTGEVLKFTRGRSQEFTPKGMPTPFESSLLVHTVENQDRLYILESQKNRVVVLQKNGDFIKEISNTSLGSVTDIIVDEAGATMYAVSGSLVFQLAI